ncbi:MAG: LacI family DNA-binding transcriptional regulator [Phycisphaeraceae bacterium]
MTVTLEHVAKRANVSASTVSLILNGKGMKYRVETRRRVLEAARALDYRPNVSAIGLRQSRSLLLGVLLSRVNAPLASAFFEGIQAAAMRESYAPLTFACGSAPSEDQALTIATDRRVDAFIINSADTTSSPANLARLTELAESGKPVVEVFGQRVPGVPRVNVDFESAGYLATRRMVEMGLKRVGFLNSNEFSQADPDDPLFWYARLMYRGYCRAVQEAGQERVLVEVPRSFEQLIATSPRVTDWLADDARRVLLEDRELDGVYCVYGLLANALSLALLRDASLLRPRFTVASFPSGLRPLLHHERRLLLSYRAAEAGRAAVESALGLLAGETVESRLIAPDIETLEPT